METLSSAPSSPIRLSGPWTKSRVREFLAEARIPMRLAANTDSGFPIVLSLWFLAEEDELLAVVHRDARIAKRLTADPRCAFEIAPNEPPYRGVRGQAIASLDPNRASSLLERLLGRPPWSRVRRTMGALERVAPIFMYLARIFRTSFMSHLCERTQSVQSPSQNFPSKSIAS